MCALVIGVQTCDLPFVEHLGAGAAGDAIVRQGAMVGFVLEGTVAIELHFLKQVSGGAGLGFMSVVLVGRHRKSPSSDSHASRGLRGDARRQAERDRTAPLGARPARSGG